MQGRRAQQNQRDAYNAPRHLLETQVTANPTAMLFSAAMMLRHVGLPHFGERIDDAVRTVIAAGTRNHTPDMGGAATTAAFTEAVLAALAAQKH